MKRYKYVSVKVGKFIGAKSDEHIDIIDEYAEKGYRYIDYIPSDMADYGKIKRNVPCYVQITFRLKYY